MIYSLLTQYMWLLMLSKVLWTFPKEVKTTEIWGLYSFTALLYKLLSFVDESKFSCRNAG